MSKFQKLDALILASITPAGSMRTFGRLNAI